MPKGHTTKPTAKKRGRKKGTPHKPLSLTQVERPEPPKDWDIDEDIATACYPPDYRHGLSKCLDYLLKGQ